MKNLFTATLTLLLSMTLLATCAIAQTANGGNANTVGETTAAQLAAALNAMHEGSARASGETVTLTRNVGMQRNLTVPAGVTLDLTGDGGIWTQRDGVTLTVNGTVNAPSTRIGFDNGSGARTMTINGNGTINLMSKGNLLNVWSGDGVARKLTLDGVTLIGIADNDSPLVDVNNGGELVLVSGAIMGNTRTSDDWASGGGVNLWHGTFTMSGGEISSNSAVGTGGGSGGGVEVGDGSVFTMSGGAITGNITAREGGGVHVWRGMFTMEGGEISGNSVIAEGYPRGGGVNVGEASVFTMSGGAITGNTTSGHSGGVHIGDGATFTMSGGAIFGNSARSGGGGVGLIGSFFTMKDGTIRGNTASSSGGGVWVQANSTFTMEGGIISGNTGGSNGGGVAVHGGGTFIMVGGSIYGASAQSGDANTAPTYAALMDTGTARWGTGGTYTIGGVAQTGGNSILPSTGARGTNDTLIAVPAR